MDRTIKCSTSSRTVAYNFGRTREIQQKRIRDLFDSDDLVDIKHEGVWYPAKILHICGENGDPRTRNKTFMFQVVRQINKAPLTVSWRNIRFRSFRMYSQDQLKPETLVLVNYNRANPELDGLWYDFFITEINEDIVTGLLFLSDSYVNCTIKYADNKFKNIEMTPFGRDAVENIPSQQSGLYESDHFIETIEQVTHNDFGAISDLPVGADLPESDNLHGSLENIHGNEAHGVYSILLDKNNLQNDKGDNFHLIVHVESLDQDINDLVQLYRDKFMSSQSNRMLHLNCWGLTKEMFGVVRKWRNGKPIRIVRSPDCGPYAPATNFRYDGIYKIVHFFPELIDSNRLVWRYHLRRHDNIPAPWVAEELKSKAYYEVDYPGMVLMKKDGLNATLWRKCQKDVELQKQNNFLVSVRSRFQCPLCMETVERPVTTKCLHNFCRKCFLLHWNLQCHFCPECGQLLQPEEFPQENIHLRKALSYLLGPQEEP